MSLPLRSERLTLRDFLPSDFAAVHAYSSDEEVVRFMFWGPRSEEETKDFLERMAKTQVESPRRTYELAMTRAHDSALVGACDVTLAREDEGNLGYLLARHAWGKGYATEAGRALIAFGFDVLRLRRIFAVCDRHNARSQRVLERLGMTRERDLRKHRHAKGRWWHSVEYAIYP